MTKKAKFIENVELSDEDILEEGTCSSYDSDDSRFDTAENGDDNIIREIFTSNVEDSKILRFHAISKAGKIFDCARQLYVVKYHINNYVYFKYKDNNYYLHELVARAFVPNPNKFPKIVHIDGNKLNNNADNLQWTE